MRYSYLSVTTKLSYVIKCVLGMAQPSLRQFKPTPPDKGSFPLDHDGECKVFYLKYMVCLSKNENSNSKCRLESKDYLNCRMDKGLMAKESWSKLGYSDLDNKAKI